jgi:hypothetical protein
LELPLTWEWECNFVCEKKSIEDQKCM